MDIKTSARNKNMAGLQFGGKETFLNYTGMSPERVSVGEEGEARSFHVDGPKTEKAREPTVESLVRGVWRLRASQTERQISRDQ